VIKQDGYYISTGISKFYGAIFCHSIWWHQNLLLILN
jgi:hypothetical protein